MIIAILIFIIELHLNERQKGQLLLFLSLRDDDNGTDKPKIKTAECFKLSEA